MSYVTDSVVRSSARTRIHQRFFLIFAVVLLVVVFLGFAPTFYLAPMFDTRTDDHPMPMYLIFHAILLTAWYVGLVVQSGLIGRGRQDLHRTLGLLWVLVAVGVVVTGVVTTLNAIPRASDFGFPSRERINVLVTTNSFNLLVFLTLVSVAIYKRSKPQVHKRLMLIASIAIIGPAVSPFRMFGIFLQSLLPDFITIPVPLIFWVLLIAALVVHDVLTSRRVHLATAWGSGAKAAAVVITLALVNSGVAAAYVNWLENLWLLGSVGSH